MDEQAYRRAVMARDDAANECVGMVKGLIESGQLESLYADTIVQRWDDANNAIGEAIDAPNRAAA